MPDAKIFIGIIAGIVALAATSVYIAGILKRDEEGRIKPNRATWFIWTVLAWIILLSYRASGAEETIWVPLGYAFGATTIFLLSIKRGVGGWTTLDKWCLACAGLSLAIWSTVGSIFALIAALSTDTAGFIPTLKKAWFEPQNEGRLAWTIGLVANFLNIFAVREWTFAVAVHPIYMFLSHVLIVAFLFRRRTNNKTAAT